MQFRGPVLVHKTSFDIQISRGCEFVENQTEKLNFEFQEVMPIPCTSQSMPAGHAKDKHYTHEGLVQKSPA